MIPPRFEYHAPKTVGEAVALLGTLGSDAKLLAGGHSLLPMMKLRFAAPEHLIDINRIPELKGIREEGSTVVIGAMTVENEPINAPVLQSKVPLLCEAAKLIADPKVRNRGTIGGGTRIAASLQDFARHHAHAQLHRGSRVWVFSDGFDTDGPELLSAALQEVRARGARITWFHPTRQVPAAHALQRAKTKIERFVPLASLADLAAARHVLH